jgi:hypothetical protein
VKNNSSNSRFLNLNDMNDTTQKSPVLNVNRYKNGIRKYVRNNKIIDQNSIEFSPKDSFDFNFQMGNKKVIRIMTKLNRRLENIETKLSDFEFRKQVQKQWSLLAKIIDRIFLYLITFLIFSLLITLTTLMPKQISI